MESEERRSENAEKKSETKDKEKTEPARGRFGFVKSEESDYSFFV